MEMNFKVHVPSPLFRGKESQYVLNTRWVPELVWALWRMDILLVLWYNPDVGDQLGPTKPSSNIGI